MAEPRIIHPTPMGPAGPKKKMEKVPKTLRFELTLQESTNLSCSEYSWLELLKKAADDDEEKLKECMDPFAQQDLEAQKKLENIAKAFESQYGSKLTKKKRKVQIEDFVDLDDGYDDTDPFVDNSEAYDELVPATLTTKLGGFYINTGVLDFRDVTGDSDGEFQSPKKKKKKIRQIVSDSDSDMSAASSISAKKRKSLLHMKKKRVDGEIKKKKRKKLTLSSGDEKQFLKKKKISKEKDLSTKMNVPNVAELIKQQATPPEKKVTVNGESATPVVPGAGKGKDSIFSTIDAVINQSLVESPDSEGRATPTFVAMPNQESAPKLPTGLPSQLEGIIKTLKESARASAIGKSKFFNPAVNRMLLVIEKEARQLVCSQRSGIYNHLAAYLPCSKETLLKRAKKLRLNEQDNKVRDPINKLKEAVNKVMPAYIEHYSQECKAAALAKTGEKSETKDDGGSSESDEDNKDEKKKSHGPRKRFTWTNQLRDLLCDVIRVKMMSYEMSKMRTQSAEEYLKTFLDTEIKPIWPKSWMQTRMLYKESRSAHAQWTISAQKPKKNMIISGRLPTSASNSPTPTTSTSIMTIAGAQKQPTKTQKTADNGLNNLMTLFDYAEDESVNKMEENDTADALSSFLDSEAANEMLMCIADNNVPMADIEEKIPLSSSTTIVKQTKTLNVGSQGNSNSFMAQFQKFTGTYKAPEEATKAPSSGSVKSEHKKVVASIVTSGQSRDLKTHDELMSHKLGAVTSGQAHHGRTLSSSGGIGLDLDQLSPPRAHYQTFQPNKTLQRSLSCEASTNLGKKPALDISLGLGNTTPKFQSQDSMGRISGASNIRRQSFEPVKLSATSPVGQYPAVSPLADVPKDNVVALAAMYANAQAMTSLVGMNSHLAGMSSHAMQQQQQKPMHNIMEFKLPLNTSDYSGKMAEAHHPDAIGLTKQHKQFLQQVTSLAPSPVHLNSSSLTSKPATTTIWGVGKPTQPAYSTPTSRSAYNIPLSRISPTNSISTGMPAGYKSISLLDQQKDSSLIHQGLQISRASTDSMRGASSGYTHHSPGSSNHSPLGHGPVSPHGHGPVSPHGHGPVSPHGHGPVSPHGQSPTDKSRSPHGY